MGEAKRRGTQKERQAEGVIKRLQKVRDEAKRRAEYEASLTPEERQKRRKTQVLLASIAGLTAGLNSGR